MTKLAAFFGNISITVLLLKDDGVQLLQLPMKTMKIKPLELALIAFFLVLAVLAGWLIVADVDSKTAQEKEPSPSRKPLLVNQNTEASNTGRTPRRSSSFSDKKDEPFFARPNERLVQFNNEEDYQKFLNALSSSDLRLIRSLDSLRAAWIGFDNLSDFDGLVDPDELGFNFVVGLPLPPGQGSVQAGAIGFNGNALEWLGITSDNSQWGEGVTLAVIDSGISPHSALPEGIQRIDLVGDSDPSGLLNGHGTAVASLIAGTNGITPGVSPSVTLLDVRVSDASGLSSSFLLAEGIVAAVEGGAQVINISLGSYGDSSLVANAVAFASANGAVIVASSGNEGFDQPAFPAAYPEVIAVGAVDQAGVLVDFSNTGDDLDITAPGLEVFAAWTDNRYIEFTGTSGSAPLVSAAVATAISELELSANDAADAVLQFANEAGAPGEDIQYGQGHLDVGRVTNSETPGIFDIAAVSNLLETDSGNSIITVVQNQGTEVINGARLTISTSFSEIPLPVPQLTPGSIHTVEVPTSLPPPGEELFISTEATLNAAFQDAEPSNNLKETSFEFEAAP